MKSVKANRNDLFNLRILKKYSNQTKQLLGKIFLSRINIVQLSSFSHY